MVVDMYYRHNFYCGDSYFWSLDPASPDSDIDETLCGPVPFLLPDSFTVHFSCGRHYFRCDGDYVYDFSDGYGVTDYIVKEDVAEFFCYHSCKCSDDCQLFTCFSVSSGKLPVIEIM